MHKQLEHDHLTASYPETFTPSRQAYILYMRLGSTNKLNGFGQVMIFCNHLTYL